MCKIFLSLVLSYSIVLAVSFNIELKKGSWNLVGTPVDLNISTLNLDDLDVVWNYKDGYWYLNKDSRLYPKLETLKANSGFWIFPQRDHNISLVNTNTNDIVISRGWTMYSPVNDMVIDRDLNSSNIGIVWKYINGHWSAWDPNNLYLNANIPKAENLKVGQGAWVYAINDYMLNKQYVKVGNDNGVLFGGNFENISKNASDDIEDIWNISFKIDTSVDYSDFNIGVKFVKESSGAMGEIVFTGLNISNGVINNPSYIIIKGVKSDSTSGQTYFYDSYNPDDILSNSVALNNSILTLKLGTIMQKQTVTSEATFKAISNYNVKINSDKLLIDESKNISLGNLTDFDFSTNFENKNGLEGMIEIH